MFQEIIDWLFGTEAPAKRKKKKVFISFAIEDIRYRNFLVSQAKNSRSPFDFIDMSVKEAWDNGEWKRKCRIKIRQCDAMIALLSKNTWHAGGARWEMKCAREEGIPLIGMHVKKDDQGAVPPELYRRRVIEWSWDNLEKVLH